MKNPMKKIIVLLLLSLLSTNLLAQDSFSSVEERMTGKEFMDAGLDKLSDVELEALNKWLRDHSVATLGNATAGRSAPASTLATAGAGAGTDTRGLDKQRMVDKGTIVSALVGEFTGWDGETIFRLENGMVWKQSEVSKFFSKGIANPMITIEAGMFDSWRLSVEGFNKAVKVERIQ